MPSIVEVLIHYLIFVLKTTFIGRYYSNFIAEEIVTQRG